MAVDSRVPAEGPGGTAGEGVLWPVRSGSVPPLADGFISRPETAPGIAAALVPGGTVVLAPAREAPDGALNWPGSCGKTQLAVGLAESLWQSREVELLVWVAATSRASVLSGYVAATVAAMGTVPEGDAEAVAARFVGWLSETTRPWLLVLDDLSDEPDLADLWPTGPTGRVLVTTTNSAALPGDHRQAVRQVGSFSRREALSYLMGRLIADTDQRLGAIDLVEELACEPLALSQAIAVITNSAMSCRDYLGYFVRRREQLTDGADAGPPPPAVTWTFSFEHADRQSPDGAAQSLLALAAVNDGHGIPGSFFMTSAVLRYVVDENTGGPAGPDRAQAVLRLLEQAGLVIIDMATSPPIIRMNPVLQEAVRGVMPDDLLEWAAKTSADGLLEAWPSEETQAWQASVLRSCAASLQQAAGDLLWAGGCHPVLLRAGRSLDDAHLTGPAVEYWKELATVSDRILGSGHPDTLVICNRLAGALLAAGRAEDAIPWVQWVLADRARALGPAHPDTIAARLNLGRALVAANKLDDAITVLRGTVGDYERARGNDHLDTVGARDELAAAYRASGQFADATRLYRRSLADRERIQGARHADTIHVREQLAEAFIADDRIKDAINQYKRALADRERVFGPDHLDTMRARGNLAAAYHTAGRMASAMQLYEQTCADYERVLGADHPDTLARRANLAHAYYSAGRLSDATTLLRDTVARCERTLPPGDPFTETVRESLTNIAGS